MKRRVLMLPVLAFVVLSAAPAPAHPAIPAVLQALGRVHSIDAVAISPDATHVAWSESVHTRTAHGLVDRQAIYMAPLRDARAAVRVSGCTDGSCDDDDFAWSPDSRALAFLSNAHDQAELFVAATAGTHARALTAHLHGPVTTPKWSPDGRSIAVLYTPGAPKTPGPLNPLGRDAGVLGSTYHEQRIAVAPLGGGAPLRLVSPANLYVYEYDWSPDGRRFAVSAAHGSGDDNWWVADLDTIDAAHGTVKRVLHPAMQIASPRWSGDGRRIAFIGGLMSDEGITGGDAYVVAAAGGTPIDVTPGVHASIMTLTWNGSPRRLIATYLRGPAMGIATLDADARTFRSRWSAPEMIFANSLGGFDSGDVGISLARDGVHSALIRQSFTRAPEIFTGRVGVWTAFTARNAGMPHVITRTRSVSWTSDGFTPQGWLTYPDGYTPGKRYPMVVVIHGGPSFANMSSFPNAASFEALLASGGFFVFAPNPRGSYGQGEAFAHANYRDFGYGDLRDILRGVDAVEKVAPVDDARIGIFGWSYGGYMTMWATTQTNRFRAAVSGAGLSDWLSYYGTNNISTWMIPFFGASVYDDPAVYARSSPITFITHERTPMLLVAGDRDAEVPITQSYEYWNALRYLHVPTEFVVYPDEGHEFHRVPDEIDVAERLTGWFDRYLR